MCQNNPGCNCLHDDPLPSRTRPRGTEALGQEISPLSQYVSQFSENPFSPEEAAAAFILIGLGALGIGALALALKGS